ncbi:MAG: PAS domain S-box protein [Candidatus Goldiibacteriota bacterium]
MGKKEMKVLIIEDSASDASLLTDKLREFKNILCEITTAGSLKESSEMLESGLFDVIFLDLNLPDSRGIETFIKINKNRKESPVIIMTAETELETILKILNTGAQNYIIKGEESAVSLERTVLYSVEREKNIGEIVRAKRIQKESEQKFSSLFFSSSVGLMLARASDGRIMEANRTLEKKFGYTREEVIGKTTIELGLWESKEIRDNVLKAAFNNGPVNGIELRFRDKKGNLIPCLFSIAPIELNNEKCAVSTIVDISEQKKYENELKLNEEQFRSAFEQAAVGIAFTDFAGRFIKLNQRYCDILGYTKEELEGRLFEDITYPENVEKDLMAISSMLKGGLDVYKTEKRYIKKDKTLVWTELTVSLARDRDKKPKYFVAVIEDITERKETKERWQAFSNSVDSCFMMFDERLKLEAANPAAYEYYETLTGQLLKLNIPVLEVLQNIENNEVLNSLKDVIYSGKPHIIDEFKMTFPGMEERYYSMKAFRVGAGMGLIMTNITELKKSELVLKASYEKLMEVDRMKSNFISIVSHEIRTPLTIIKGFTAFLLKESSGPLNAVQKGYVNTLEENTNRLARIINDMVDMSRIERGTFIIEKEERDLAGIIEETLESMKNLVKDKGIELEKMFKLNSAFCRVDKGRIFQALSNLINNSIRFSKKGDRIKLRLENASLAMVPESLKGKFLENKVYYFVSVMDQGIGLDKNNLEKVFDRFYQVENADVRTHAGSGLGLSIARSIVESHGGFIWAESEGLGKGTEICFVLPE